MLLRIKDGDKNKFQKLRVNISEFKYDKDIILKNIDLKINHGDKFVFRENQEVENLLLLI